MKRSALVTLAAVVAVAACQEVATSPQIADLRTLDSRVSNPPPPPIDTGASFTPSTTFNRSSPANETGWIRLASAFQDDCTEDPDNLVLFIPDVPVTYMYDPAGNTGWLHFSDAPFDAADTDANGMIRMRQDETGAQDFTGKGSIRMMILGCEVIIRLSEVSDTESHFGECSTVTEARQDETPPRDQGCFFVEFDSVLVNGEWTQVNLEMTPAPPPCEPNDERPFCNDIDLLESSLPRKIVVPFRNQRAS